MVQPFKPECRSETCLLYRSDIYRNRMHFPLSCAFEMTSGSKVSTSGVVRSVLTCTELSGAEHCASLTLIDESCDKGIIFNIYCVDKTFLPTIKVNDIVYIQQAFVLRISDATTLHGRMGKERKGDKRFPLQCRFFRASDSVFGIDLENTRKVRNRVLELRSWALAINCKPVPQGTQSLPSSVGGCARRPL